MRLESENILKGTHYEQNICTKNVYCTREFTIIMITSKFLWELACNLGTDYTGERRRNMEQFVRRQLSLEQGAI